MTDQLQHLQATLGERYTLHRRIGRGGMATVYLAHDRKHDRPVAVKVLHPELAAVMGAERFTREVRLAARLQHPHILTVLDSGTGEQGASGAAVLWFTMPFVEGESLRDRLVREKQLPLEDALRIAREAALALDFAHRHGVIHRDVKPENILLCDGQALVADFGIARASEADDPRLTATGVVVGTPAYMSPEQASGARELGPGSDVYALGCVLYEMLAGEPPHTGPTAQAILARRLGEPAPSVRRARAAVPPAVDATIGRALAPVPADRFGSAAEFAAGLESRAAPLQIAGRSRARRLLALAVIVALAALFGWWGVRRDGSPAPGQPARLAVLPFENLGTPADEYFVDGVTDAIRGKLTTLPGLQVIARASSTQYKGTGKTTRQVGRELGVDYLLTGTVRWEKEEGRSSRIQVNPELIRVSTAAAEWQQPFDAVLSDMFRVQGDVAGRVADALGLAIGAGQRERLSERPTADLAAYDAFLKGEEISQGLGVFDPVTLERAVPYYERAVALDPRFVQAWAQLSRAHSQIHYGAVPSPDRAERARAAAQRAMDIAPERLEPHLAAGDYQRLVRDDFTQALVAYRAGLAIAPTAPLLRGMAAAEHSLGQWEAALEHAGAARALDPRSPFVFRQQAITLVWLRRYEEAQSVLEEGLALDSTHLSLILWKTLALLGQGDSAGARAFLRGLPSTVDPTALVAYISRYWDLYWALDARQQELLLRLTPGPFGDDRAGWGLALAQTHYLRGDIARARAYADSARIAFETQLPGAPEDAQSRALFGLALAYQGRRPESIHEGERAVELTRRVEDAHGGPYVRHLLTRIYLLAGETENALSLLDTLLQHPYYLSPAWLRIDPAFDPLRASPRFQALAREQ